MKERKRLTGNDAVVVGAFVWASKDDPVVAVGLVWQKLETHLELGRVAEVGNHCSQWRQEAHKRKSAQRW